MNQPAARDHGEGGGGGAPSLRTAARAAAAPARALRGGKSDENIDLLTRVWGASLGEVIRREHTGQWSERESSPAIQTENTTLFPHDQIRKRLTLCAEHSLVEYVRGI